MKSRTTTSGIINLLHYRYYFERIAKDEVAKIEDDSNYEVTQEMVQKAENDVKQMERIKVVQNSVFIV